jgi:hypothetical protein
LFYVALQKKRPPSRRVWQKPEFHVAETQDVAEIDFPIGIPERRSLVLETKSGEIEIERGHWPQNERRMRASPLEQAVGRRKTLVARLVECGEKEIPYMANGVFFPESDVNQGYPETIEEHALPSVEVDEIEPRPVCLDSKTVNVDGLDRRCRGRIRQHARVRSAGTRITM